MHEDTDPQTPRSETDKTLSELGRGKAERVVLGNNPYGSMLRIVLAAVLFIVVFGTLFFSLNQ